MSDVETWVTLPEDHGEFATVIRLHQLEDGRGNRMVFRLTPDAVAAKAPTAMMSVARRGQGPAQADGVTMGATSVSRKVHPVPPDQPTSWLIDEALEPDVVEATVRWEWSSKDGKAFQHEKVVSLVNKKAYNADAPAVRDLGSMTAPRLVVGINAVAVEPVEVGPGVSFDLPAIDGKTLQRPPLGPEHVKGLELILQTIARKLDEGLDGVWSKIDTRFPDLGRLEQEAAERGTKQLSRQHLEELWARRVTELLAFTPYSGSGGQYYQSMAESKLATFEIPLLTRVLDDDDPCYPIVCACQHLAMLGFTTRGVAWSGMFPLSAGSKTLETIRQVGGTYYLKPDAPYTGSARPLKNLGTCDFNKAKNALAVPGFGPGTVMVWANRRGKAPIDRAKMVDANGTTVILGADDEEDDSSYYVEDNKDGAHIAFVLRKGFPAGTVQFFDTGGVGVPGRTAGLEAYRPKLFGPLTGIYDDPSSTEIPCYPSRGVGVPPDPGDEGLRKAVERLARARPLGYARLVLIDRQAKTPHPPAAYLYVSPWLRMHRHGEPTKNYPYARYAWSLRGLPGNDRIEARWLFDTPSYLGKSNAPEDADKRHPDVLMKHDGARVRTLSGLAQGHPQLLNKDQKLISRRVLELQNVPDADVVQVVFRRADKAKSFIGAEKRINLPTGVSPAGHQAAPLQVPPYFAQEGTPVKLTSDA